MKKLRGIHNYLLYIDYDENKETYINAILGTIKEQNNMEINLRKDIITYNKNEIYDILYELDFDIFKAQFDIRHGIS